MAPDAPTPDPSPATIEGYGECRRCHQHRRLVAHGATCQPCLNRIEAARWVERTFTVSLDVGSYGEDVDDEEITYLLRMGGIDAEVIPMPDPSPDTPSTQHTDFNKENTNTMDNTPNTISIDGTDYVRADSVPSRNFSSSPVRIVVLQRGWVVVGYYTEDGDKVTIDRAKIIRRWGTTKGLGELATGPVSDSVLDPAGLVETHRLGVVLTIACDADAWKAHL